MDEPVDPRVSRLVNELLGPLFALEGGTIHAVRRKDDGYVLEVGGSLVGCPALDLTKRTVIEPAFEKALGAPVWVRLEVRPSG